jgi:hypothetical protein
LKKTIAHFAAEKSSRIDQKSKKKWVGLCETISVMTSNVQKNTNQLNNWKKEVFMAKSTNLPIEIEKLRTEIAKLHASQRTQLLPLLERLQHYIHLHARLLSIAQEAIDQLQLDAKYMQFDLEATRRERDELERMLFENDD